MCPPRAVKQWTQLHAPEAGREYFEKLRFLFVSATCYSDTKDTEVDQHFFTWPSTVILNMLLEFP